MPADFETRVLLRSEKTGGQISAIENVVPRKWDGPPLHTHELDETFYVLGGELTFQLEEALTKATGGDVVFAPRGVPHALANQSDADASYLLFCTPAGFARYVVGKRMDMSRIDEAVIAESTEFAERQQLENLVPDLVPV